jgi:Rab3 GTPase-activating protein catalytic subunit
MTEDMLEQHASVLVNLGQSDDASLLRAKIQSASLLSDMQSFKAANPDCILEDFVRWYSPRDWIEIEEKRQIINDSSNTAEEITIKKYELSNRMKMPDNIWSEVWSNAKPIPARKQKRLFDDTKEAENVFEWLNSLTINKIIEHLMPCLLHTAILKCYDESIKLDLNYILETSLDLLIEKSIKITRNNSEPKKYQELMQHIKPIEQLTSLMKAINIKFIENNNNKHLINSDNVHKFIRYFNNIESFLNFKNIGKAN